VREYSLINKSIDVDLTTYEDIIKNVVAEVVPDAEVIVSSDKYTVNYELTRSQVVEIGRALARTKLGEFSAVKYVLFKGKEINR
jgi:hypothetical protein